MASEFELIRRYFSRPAPSAVLGVGDDCALVRPKPGMTLAVTTDMLLEGTHFHAGTDARRLGHKSLAVNLSDLAAMGADPRWGLLSLALPAADESWLAAFADGFYSLAARYGVDLVGGDTTRGPLAISVTLIGEVPAELALRRDGALAGDDIWVSGATGEAALALAALSGRTALADAHRTRCLARLEAPEPRVDLGGRLRGIARSAIDVSDGLLADLGHILERSGAGAEVWYDALPRAPAIAACGDAALVRECLTGGGDDYELLFTVPPNRRDEIQVVSADLGLALTRIGSIVPGEARAVLRDAQGNAIAVERPGFDHFR
jgi:thiamine-monophosphate kinase